MSKTPSVSAETTPSVQPNLNHTMNLMNRLEAFLPLIKKANQELSDVDVLKVDTNLEKEDGNDSDDDGSDDVGDGNDSGIESGEKSHGSDPKIVELAHHRATTAPSNPTIQIEFAVGELNDNPIMKFLTNNSESLDDGIDTNNLDREDDYDNNERKRAAVTKLLAVDDTCEDKQPPRKKSLITEL